MPIHAWESRNITCSSITARISLHGVDADDGTRKTHVQDKLPELPTVRAIFISAMGNMLLVMYNRTKEMVEGWR